MKVGVFIYNTDDGADPLVVAQEAERLGFESIFCPDHTHIPASRLSPFPMPPFGDLPREYYRMRDPFVSLSGIAAVTSKIMLGTSVCVVVERDPILLAKTVASLDLMSNGRVLLGVGAGWNLEEMQNHGTNPKTRMKLLRERVGAMREIWSQEQAEFHGDLVDFDPIFSWPKPVQKPGVPIIVGGSGPTVLDRVVAFGDGWFPGHQQDLDELKARMDELQEKAAAAGRAPIPVTIMGGLPAFFERYAEMGASRCVCVLPAGPTDASLDALNRLAPRVRELGFNS